MAHMQVFEDSRHQLNIPIDNAVTYYVDMHARTNKYEGWDGGGTIKRKSLKMFSPLQIKKSGSTKTKKYKQAQAK